MISETGTPPVTASIVVPTRNNAKKLAACLDSVLRDASETARELIVVDNDSSDDTANVVNEKKVAAPFPVRLITETQIGSSPARNAGIAHSAGEIVLFADDDVLVASGWADALVLPFSDPSVGAVGGRTLPLWPVPPPAWLNGPHAETLTLPDFGRTSRSLSDHEVPVSANLAVRGSIVRSYATPFELDLGYRHGRRYGYEETLLLTRIRERHRIAYAAEAVARHQIDPDRMTLGWMRRTYFDRGVGRARSDRHQRRELPSLARRVVRAGRMLRHTLRGRRLNDSRERKGAETAAELMDYLGTGLHVEMIFHRFPRITDVIGAVVSRT